MHEHFKAMAQDSCPFCSLDDSDRVFYRDDLTVALWDGYPISPGHALVVPRRHVAGWFEASAEEHAALVRAIDAARAAILERHRPDGFNIGVNVGAAAGQTVFHLHVHLIPRYAGDVADPRGGVRRLIPDKACYWERADGEP
jgi:ATP adenylyltransferase